MVLMQVSTDRWQAHREISEVHRSDVGRGHLWRFVGEGEAKIRLVNEPITIPEEGTEVSFRIDCVPRVISKGKRKRFPLEEWFINQWVLDRLGVSLEVDHITSRLMTMRITRDAEETFIRPSARVVGRGKILDCTELEKLLRNGIGDAKAYGYGMLEIDRIEK